ncbi:phosphate/phosphite/phosphonate ABC transporter substrate-binding protein [Corynebacterium glyciniphilum]|uniref:phosphate/phosphite/phosphonate ABC transporter substrate-binding protein n=1 Tax=Corynebacterium glyciniphilum TaxID=1404244 RepID=UPI0011AB5EBE|nr:phosphate/phosphite/phosphonate ABC transporter substrate-binding protein [Corynebacterium glyciniphilum]
MPTVRRATVPATVLTVLAALFATTACAPGGHGPYDPVCPNGKIAFGIEPYEAPDKLEPAYQVIADDLSDTLDCEVDVQIVEDYSAEVLAMRNGSLNLGQFGPLGYVFADRIADAEPIVSFGDAEGKLSTYTAGIWVAKDSPVQSIADLRDRQLALGGVGSTSGDALPRMAVSEAGLSEDDLTMDYTGGHPEALLALKNGAVDAAQINSQTLTSATAEGTFNPDDFRRIWISDPIPNDPITIPGDANPELKKNLREALTSLSPETVTEVAAFLDVDPPGPLVTVTKDDYRSLFHLADELGMTPEDVE